MLRRRNIKRTKWKLKTRKLLLSSMRMIGSLLRKSTRKMKWKRKKLKRRLERKRRISLSTLRSCSNIEREKLTCMERFKEIWLHAGIYNLILRSLTKNFRDNRSCYITQNIRFNLWKEELQGLKVKKLGKRDVLIS